VIRLSLLPSPASDTSAFNNIRAFSMRCAGLFPFRRSASNRSRCDESESQNPHPFKLIEAGDRVLEGARAIVFG
jgi:hypothetical protein